MIRIRNLQEMRQLPDCSAKRAMEMEVSQILENDEELLEQLEESFDEALGGDWYIHEKNDDPRNLTIDSGPAIDLLSPEWNWCDVAHLNNCGCYFVFWATNNAGGPCLFVPDDAWVPDELRSRLNDLINSQEE